MRTRSGASSGVRIASRGIRRLLQPFRATQVDRLGFRVGVEMHEDPDDERHRFMFASYNAGEGTINRAMAVAQLKLGGPGWQNIEQVAPTVKRWRGTRSNIIMRS